MIIVTGLNNKEFYLNCDLFEKIEATPDTVITLTSGKKYVVKDSPEVLIGRIIEYRRNFLIYSPEVIK